MTTPLELLHDLHRVGVRLTLADDDLIAKPTSRVTPELVDRIRVLKPDMMRILAGPSDACEHCGGDVVRDRTFDGYLNRLCLKCGRWFTCTRSQTETNR